jgi:hypothetical protein
MKKIQRLKPEEFLGQGHTEYKKQSQDLIPSRLTAQPKLRCFQNMQTLAITCKILALQARKLRPIRQGKGPIWWLC